MFKLRCGFLISFTLVLTSYCRADGNLGKLDKIVVKKNNASFIGYYLNEEDIQSLPFSSPVELLSILPFNLQSRSPNSGIQADFSLRGSNFQGVRVLFNGQRINDPQTGHHNSDIPLTVADLDSVDLSTGISPDSLGPDAIGGTVNFVSKKPIADKTILELVGGSDKSFGQLFSLTKKIEKIGMRFSLENRESDGFAYDTDFKKTTASFASSAELPLGELNFDFGYQDKKFGAYDFYTPNKGYPSREWTETYLLNTGVNLDKEGIIVKPNFLWRRHFDKFLLDKTNLKSNYIAHHRTDIYTPSIYVKKGETIFGSVGVGVEYSEETINSTSLGKHGRQRKSIYIEDSLSIIENLKFDSSFRLDDYDGSDTAYTGGVKLLYGAVSDGAAYFSIGRSIRIPSFTELYYNDPTTVGNSAISPEKALSYEIGYNYKNSNFSFGAAFFYRCEDDFIDWVKYDPNQVKWEASNIVSSDVFGLEEHLELKINDKVNIRTNYVYTNKDKNNNGYLYKYGENYARHLVNCVSFFMFKFGTQELGFTYKKTPSRDGWFLGHARLSYNLSKNSLIFFTVNNIFNVEYQEIEGVPSPGRLIEGGLRFVW